MHSVSYFHTQCVVGQAAAPRAVYVWQFAIVVGDTTHFATLVFQSQRVPGVAE